MRRRGNGEGSIWIRPDGRYCAALVVNGRRRFAYGRTREDAARRLHELVVAQRARAPLPSQRETVESFFAAWLAGAKSTVRLRTWERYESLIRLHLLPALGRARLARLEPAQLHRLYQDQLAAGQSPASVHQLHAVIHRGLGQGLRWGQVTRNVAALVDPPRIRRREMQVLNVDEVRRLLEAAAGTRWEALLTVAVTTGMRQGELLALRWRELDLTDGGLSVNRTVQRSRQEGFLVAEPKTARSRRRIALSAGAVDALRRHRVRQTQERLEARSWADDLDLVFPNGKGRFQEVPSLTAQYRTLLAAAGVPRLRFHDLRHTAATLMLGKGVHPKVASEMLGHSTVGMTLDLYSHVSETMQRDAAATLDQLLWD